MSATLLNTNTTTFLELIGNGKLFRVPPYQRSYSWGVEQWEDLWTDLEDLRARPQASHYMGALVVEAVSDRSFQIIDGQQRVTTLSVLALAVVARLLRMAEDGQEPEANRERAAALRARFLGEKDPASLMESSKLSLSKADDPFYQDNLLQLRPPLTPRSLSSSNRKLWECFQYFSKQLDHAFSKDAPGADVARLLSETVGRQLVFILITVDDEVNAYTVFETLNARGLELSATDLLKNYLFSRVSVESDLAVLQRRWERLLGLVGAESFPEFLRYHLLVETPNVRSQRLFKLVRERVRTPKDVFDLMDVLEERGEVFAALQTPEHEYWMDAPADRAHVRDLRLFHVRQMTPLVFAVWEKFAREDVSRVLKLLVAMTFRYTVVGRLNTHPLENAYHRAAKAVWEGEATKPRDVFRLLRPVYVEDQQFEQDFARLNLHSSGQRKKLARYILTCLEAHASGITLDPETVIGTIEHILPQNPSGEWASALPPDQWDAYINRVGNLVLLEPALNRSLGSASFERKIETFAQSRFVLTRELAEERPDEWSVARIEARSGALARQASRLWRSDFA